MADLTFELDPQVSRAVYDGICALWVEVTNADGAVGFVPPVTRDDVRPELITHLAAVADGRTRLVLGRDRAGGVAATAFLTFNTHRLMRHWVWVDTVQVHPAHQGRGNGRALMAAVRRAAGEVAGITGIRLSCRGGAGLERFYAACGYREVGRVPGAVRIAEGEFRDDVTMWLPLT